MAISYPHSLLIAKVINLTYYGYMNPSKVGPESMLLEFAENRKRFEADLRLLDRVYAVSCGTLAAAGAVEIVYAAQSESTELYMTMPFVAAGTIMMGYISIASCIDARRHTRSLKEFRQNVNTAQLENDSSKANTELVLALTPKDSIFHKALKRKLSNFDV